MSTSPLPPDPYEALGISKDADADSVKKAHRKLVLKHHPDRIKDPSLIEENKNAFQKVQQAYEILIDPSKRQRYDDQIKLAQLRKERMMSERESPRPMSTPMPTPTYTRTTYAARPSPAPTQPMQREYKAEPRYAYEEREPDSYFSHSSSRLYEEPLPRANARKVDSSYEKRPSLSKPVEKKKEERPKATGWSSHVGAGIPIKMAFNLKEKATMAKERAKEKDAHAKAAKARDKDERRDRDQKHTYTRHSSHADDYSSESSGDDTVLAEGRRGARERSPAPPAARDRSPLPRAARERSPGPKLKRQPSAEPPRSRRQQSPRPSYEEPRPTYHDEPRGMNPSDSEDSGAEKFERLHMGARAYMAEALKVKGGVRPPLSRQGSDIHVYWTAPPAKTVPSPKDHRRSGSDSDRQRPQSSHKPPGRSVAPEEPRHRPPMPHHTSAPAGVKAAARTVERDSTPRSRQNSYDSRNHRRDMVDKMPELKRSGSAPMPAPSAKRDSVPVRGSTLKHAETNHDSGYESKSNPNTPDMRDDSPPRERESRGREPQSTSIKYRAQKDPGGEGIHKAREIVPDADGGPINRFLSPEDAIPVHQRAPETRERDGGRERERERERDRERRRSLSRDPESRSRSSRPQPERRPSINRAESSSRYEELRPRRHGERSPERGSYTRAVDPKSVRYTSHHHQQPATSKHVYNDHHPSSMFQRTVSGFRGDRRPSVSAGY